MEDRAADLEAPVTFIYGENDWMDPSAGERICKMLQAAAPVATESGIPAIPGRGSAAAPHTAGAGGRYRNRVLYVADTSHFPFMEKPDVFNELLADVVGHCLTRGAGAGTGTAGAEAAADVGHHGVVVDESDAGVTVEALEAAFVDS